MVISTTYTTLWCIEDISSTSKNPQANEICERMHQTVGNILRTLLHRHPPSNEEQAKDIVDNALGTAMHVMRSATTRTLNNISPGSLAFHRDFF